MKPADAANGFTLVEMAITLIVVAILVAASLSALRPAAARVDAMKAERFQQLVRQALLNFAETYHRLPCPDVSGDGYEDDCETNQNLRTGRVPYHSIDVELSTSIGNMQSGVENIWYGVYRRSDANVEDDSDLARLKARSGISAREDFRQALVNASLYHAANGVSENEIHVTGDRHTSGNEDCAQNRVVNVAFVLISAVRDMDGSGTAFDGIHNAWNASGGSLCAASPVRMRDATYDDRVIAYTFEALIGELDRAR